jgi:hypothetical protein
VGLIEPVAEAAEGGQAAGVLAELDPDPADVDGDGTVAGQVALAPDGIHQLAAAQGDALVQGQMGEEFELTLGQGGRFAVHQQGPATAIKEDPIVADHIGSLLAGAVTADAERWVQRIDPRPASWAGSGSWIQLPWYDLRRDRAADHGYLGDHARRQGPHQCLHRPGQSSHIGGRPMIEGGIESGPGPEGRFGM